MSIGECPEALVALLARIEHRLERIERRLEHPPESARLKRTKSRYAIIYEIGSALGRDMAAARKLRRLIVGAAVTHDPELARLIGPLRRDPECPTSERRLWALLRNLGGAPAK